MENNTEQRGKQGDGAHIPLFRYLLPLLILTFVMTVLFVTATDGRRALAAFQRINPLSVMAALLLAIVPWFTDAARSMVWCRFLGRPVPYFRLIRIAAASELGAAVAPPVVGTVPVKTVLLSREGFTSGEALSLTTIAGLEDWIFYLIALPFCLAVSGTAALSDLPLNAPAFVHIGAWAVGCGILVYLVAYALRHRWRELPFSSAVRKRADGLARWFTGTWNDLAGVYRLVAERGAAPFLLTLLLTAVQWGCRYSVAAVLIGGMGLPSYPALFFSLQILIYGMTTIVPTPGGAGGAEALFALVHRPFLPGASLGVVTAAWRVTTFYLPVLLASMIAVVQLSAIRRCNGPSSSVPGQSPPA
jgi:hypothetical protein